MARVNEPPPPGPFFGRPKPVESQQKQAGGNPQGLGNDVVTIRGGQGLEPLPESDGMPGSSRAYLIIIGMVVVMLASAGWWGGQLVLVGTLLGWLTAVMLWMVRKDLFAEFHDLFW